MHRSDRTEGDIISDARSTYDPDGGRDPDGGPS